MPVRKIEDRIQEQGFLGNLPRIGVIRKGAEHTDNKQRLQDLDHFRVVFEDQYTRPENDARPIFINLYGEKPQVLRNAYLAAENANSAFTYWLEYHNTNTLLKRCDGEEIVLWYDDETHAHSTQRMDCTCDPNPRQRECGYSGKMDIVLPEFNHAFGVSGKFTILTTSEYDCYALRAAMVTQGVRVAQLQKVQFWQIPFEIGRSPREVRVTTEKGRMKKEMWLLYARPMPEFERTVLIPALTNGGNRLLAGVDPLTGALPAMSDMPELPDMISPAGENWHWEYVIDQTAHLFQAEKHQTNTLKKMIRENELQPDMTDEQAIAAIKTHAEQKASQNAPQSSAEGSNPVAGEDEAQEDLQWALDPKTAATFVAKALRNLKLDHQRIIVALQQIQPDLKDVQEFVGTKQRAWAACIAMMQNYDPDAVKKYLAGSANQELRNEVLAICDQVGIPF